MGTQVPNQLIVHVILDIGHRVGQRATVEGVAALLADVDPDLGERGSCGFSFAMLVQFYALTDSCHGGIRFGHCVSSSGVVGDGSGNHRQVLRSKGYRRPQADGEFNRSPIELRNGQGGGE